MITEAPDWVVAWVQAFIIAPGDPLTGRGCDGQPDADLWRAQLRADLAERFGDLATADAALCAATGMQPAAEADLWRVVRQNMRELAAVELSRRKTIAESRAPLAKGNAERTDDADRRIAHFTRLIRKAELDALASNTQFRKALGVVIRGEQRICPGPNNTQITISRMTLGRDLKAIRERLLAK